METIKDLNQKPEITYPCAWEYRIIGKDHTALTGCVKEIMGDKHHILTLSNQSTKGTFVSLSLTLTVESEQERLGLFQNLSGAREILYIL